MLAGADPYKGMTAAAVIGHKLAPRGDQVPIPRWLTAEGGADAETAALAALARRCTARARRARPSAAAVAAELEAMLAGEE